MPRVAHESHGLSATRSPGATRVTAGPTRSTTPTASWPGMSGKETSPLSGLSIPASMKTSLVSLPQMPQRAVRTTVQSPPGRTGSGTSLSRVGPAELR